jgi:hypothetical protein
MIPVLDLDPYERCGPLKGGLRFLEARAAVGQAARPFRKSPLADHDALDVSGRMHIFFDADGGCTGVEVFAASGLSVTRAGRELLTADGPSFVETLVTLGQHWEIDTYGIKAPMLGLATFHPDFDWDRGARGIDALYVSLDPGFVP